MGLSRLLPIVALAAGIALAGEARFGKPLVLKETTPIQALVEHPGKYVDKPVQVKGKVSAVCQMMGCWMELVDEANRSVRIKVKDGEIVFPKDAAGRTAVAEGTLAKIELSREQAVARAKHEAEERGVPFDPESVKSGAVIYQIRGAGAVLLD